MSLEEEVIERVAAVRRGRSLGEWTMERCGVETVKDEEMRRRSVSYVRES